MKKNEKMKKKTGKKRKMMKKERKMKKLDSHAKILDDFHDFVSECVNQQPVLGGNRFFRRKVTIFIGRETKTHILQAKINEKNR